MTKLLFSAAVLGAVILLNGCLSPQWPSAADNQDIIDLVNQVCTEIQKDAKGTFAKIDAGKHPYVNKDKPAFYVYVYDTSVTIAAHPNPSMVRRNCKGFSDAGGKKYRDQLVAGALRDGSGWIDYLYAVQGAKAKHRKFIYYKLATGDDGAKYVVCCGAYRD